MLAILLTDMWDAAKARNYDRPTFDEDLYHEYRSHGLSLDDFLGRQLQALRGLQPDVVNSGLALDLLAYHTTPLGTAEQRTMADLEQTYRHRQDVLPDLVQECRDLYLLVDPSRNQPGQPKASRLTHDTLAPHVRKRFDESEAPGQRARRILESRTVDWEDGKTGTPLDEADLLLVEAGQQGMRFREPDEERLVLASAVARAQRQEEQRLLEKERKDAQERELQQAHALTEEQRLRAEEGDKAARGLRRRLILVAAIGIIAIIVAVVAFRFARLSVINKGIAINERQQARAGELAANAQVELAHTTPDHSLALLLATESSKIRPADDKLEVFPASFRALAESVAAAPAYTRTLPPHLHAGAIHSIAFSPQCLRPGPAEGQPCPRALLTAGEDATARLWDPETLEQLKRFSGHEGWVESAHFSPDGSRVLTIDSADEMLRVWNVTDEQKQPEVIHPQDGQLWAAGFTPDSQGLVTVGASGVTRVWDIATGRETRQIPAAAGAPIAAISPDGTTLAVVTGRDLTSVLLIEVASGVVRRTLPIGQGVTKVEFLSDGKKLARLQP